MGISTGSDTRADETRQLEAARRALVAEFEGRLPAEQVDERFDEIVHRFDTAPVRSFVPVLAQREARARLRDLTP